MISVAWERPVDRTWGAAICPCTGFQNVKGAQQVFVNGYHSTRIIKLAKEVGCHRRMLRLRTIQQKSSKVLPPVAAP